jgi:hypothetical protein
MSVQSTKVYKRTQQYNKLASNDMISFSSHQQMGLAGM